MIKFGTLTHMGRSVLDVSHAPHPKGQGPSIPSFWDTLVVLTPFDLE